MASVMPGKANAARLSADGFAVPWSQIEEERRREQERVAKERAEYDRHAANLAYQARYPRRWAEEQEAIERATREAAIRQILEEQGLPRHPPPTRFDQREMRYLRDLRQRYLQIIQVGQIPILSIPLLTSGVPILAYGELTPEISTIIETVGRLIFSLDSTRQSLSGVLGVSPIIADLVGFAYGHPRGMGLPSLATLRLVYPSIPLREVRQYSDAVMGFGVRLGPSTRLSESIGICHVNPEQNYIPISLFAALSYLYEYDPRMVHIVGNNVVISNIPHEPWQAP